MNNLININLFAGPGVGKSTTAAGLFHKMKIDKLSVEYVQEYAKDLTYGKDYVKLSDQLLLLGKQHHRMFRLKDHVDYIIHDSSFIVGMVYANEELLPLKEFEALLMALYSRYNHINIFLERNLDIGYQEYGRSQTLDEAIKKDEEIKNWLAKNEIPFYEVKVGPNCTEEIYNIVKGEGNWLENSKTYDSGEPLEDLEPPSFNSNIKEYSKKLLKYMKHTLQMTTKK